MPPALFGKAWITTGHVTAETLVANSTLTMEDIEKAHLLVDPLQLQDVLGEQNADEPSLEEMIESGENKRKRIIWLLGSKDDPEVQALLPACLVWPVEKKLCNYLYMSATHQDSVKPLSTIVFSRRSGKEVGAEMLRKNTVLNQGNTRSLKQDAANRTAKEQI